MTQLGAFNSWLDDYEEVEDNINGLLYLYNSEYNEESIWTTEKKQEIKYKDLESDHLLNIIAFIYRKSEERRWAILAREASEKKEFTAEEGAKYINCIYEQIPPYTLALITLALRRGLSLHPVQPPTYTPDSFLVAAKLKGLDLSMVVKEK